MATEVEIDLLAGLAARSQRFKGVLRVVRDRVLVLEPTSVGLCSFRRGTRAGEPRASTTFPADHDRNLSAGKIGQILLLRHPRGLLLGGTFSYYSLGRLNEGAGRSPVRRSPLSPPSLTWDASLPRPRQALPAAIAVMTEVQVSISQLGVAIRACRAPWAPLATLSGGSSR